MLADEAHGTHLYFGDNLPMNSMKAGADMAAISMHKIRWFAYTEFNSSDE